MDGLGHHGRLEGSVCGNTEDRGRPFCSSCRGAQPSAVWCQISYVVWCQKARAAPLRSHAIPRKFSEPAGWPWRLKCRVSVEPPSHGELMP